MVEEQAFCRHLRFHSRIIAYDDDYRDDYAYAYGILFGSHIKRVSADNLRMSN